MELCKNGKSVRLDFVIKRRNGEPMRWDEKAKANIYEDTVLATVPLEHLKNPNRRSRLAILAFLHSRGHETHDTEVGKYTATLRDDIPSIEVFIAAGLAERKQAEEAAKAATKARREALKAERRAAAKTTAQPIAIRPAAIPSSAQMPLC